MAENQETKLLQFFLNFESILNERFLLVPHHISKSRPHTPTSVSH